MILSINFAGRKLCHGRRKLSAPLAFFVCGGQSLLIICESNSAATCDSQGAATTASAAMAALFLRVGARASFIIQFGASNNPFRSTLALWSLNF